MPPPPVNIPERIPESQTTMSRLPSARAVDWSIFAVVFVQAGTGVASILAGRPDQAWLFWLHGIGGLVLVGLVAMKLWRVRGRLHPARWERDTIFSLLAATFVFATLGTGIAWASGFTPWVYRWTLLTIHAILGLLLLVPVLLHLSRRYQTPRAVDFEGRRTAIQFAVLAGTGTLAWVLQQRLAALLEVSGRFTGSSEEGSFEGNGFPTTSWVADDPDPIDPKNWSLTVDGAVASELELSESDLSPRTDREALLDCTSGWYSQQRWQGITVGSLLDRAGPASTASWVTFHSITGYRWSLPLSEAADALLATHVGGEELSHGHGYPLRLVAPGRRGFQWVKWVNRLEVRTRPDYGQWAAIFTSGFD